MSKKIRLTPQGKMILVKPMPQEDFKMGSGIIAANTELTTGEVVEVSKEFSEVYSIGDIVLYPKNAGDSQPYRGEAHIWLNGQGYPIGNIFSIITQEK